MTRNILFLPLLLLTSLTSLSNDYTLVFDGTNDIGGLVRQTTIDASELTFTDEFSFSEGGVDFSIKKATEEGRGFALVNAGGLNAGLMVYAKFPSQTDAACYPVISLSVPGGTIYGVKIYMSGPGLLSLDVPINGVASEAVQDGQLFYWSWTSESGSEQVNIKWDNTFFSRYIHSIELNYSEDLGGKEASGLEFNKKSVEVVMGQPFSTPALQNPHNLPVVWSSSDPAVATVDAKGEVTLIGGGKTMISVSTDGDESYARGSAKYDLVVIPSAENIHQLSEYAPETYDRVMVNFPATVMYGNSYFAYVVDKEGNAAIFDNIKDAASTTTIRTIYNAGDIIPAGWIATNSTINGSTSWQGIPDDVTEKVEVSYPKVESVSSEDANRVVTLLGVTFRSATPSGYESIEGIGATGESYIFQDVFGIGSKPAGKYDVTGVVCYSKSKSSEYFYIAPIAYERSTYSGIDTVEGHNVESSRWFNLQGVEVAAPGEGVTIEVKEGKTRKYIKK